MKQNISQVLENLDHIHKTEPSDAFRKRMEALAMNHQPKVKLSRAHLTGVAASFLLLVSLNVFVFKFSRKNTERIATEKAESILIPIKMIYNV